MPPPTHMKYFVDVTVNLNVAGRSGAEKEPIPGPPSNKVKRLNKVQTIPHLAVLTGYDEYRILSSPSDCSSDALQIMHFLPHTCVVATQLPSAIDAERPALQACSIMQIMYAISHLDHHDPTRVHLLEDTSVAAPTRDQYLLGRAAPPARGRLTGDFWERIGQECDQLLNAALTAISSTDRNAGNTELLKAVMRAARAPDTTQSHCVTLCSLLCSTFDIRSDKDLHLLLKILQSPYVLSIVAREHWTSGVAIRVPTLCVAESLDYVGDYPTHPAMHLVRLQSFAGRHMNSDVEMYIAARLPTNSPFVPFFNSNDRCAAPAIVLPVFHDPFFGIVPHTCMLKSSDEPDAAFYPGVSVEANVTVEGSANVGEGVTWMSQQVVFTCLQERSSARQLKHVISCMSSEVLADSVDDDAAVTFVPPVTQSVKVVGCNVNQVRKHSKDIQNRIQKVGEVSRNGARLCLICLCACMIALADACSYLLVPAHRPSEPGIVHRIRTPSAWSNSAAWHHRSTSRRK